MMSTQKDEVLKAVLDKLGNEYKYIKLIGSGAFSKVYLIRHEILQQERVLKIMSLGSSDNKEKYNQVTKKFIEEARLVQKVNHPNILRIYDISFINDPIRKNFDIPYIIMGFTAGVTLRVFLNRDVNIDLNRIGKITGDILSALSVLHKEGIIHKDIKPDNIMIEERSGKAVLIDFGFAAKLPENPGEKIPYTPGGTPTYMAPEQFDQDVELRPASDIYSFGVLLYEMLAGVVPFKGELDVIKTAHQKAPVPDIRDVNPLVPKKIQEVIEKALAKDPNSRYARVDDIAADLKDWIEKKEDKDDKKGENQEKQATQRKKKAQWSIYLFVGVVVASIILYIFYPVGKNGNLTFEEAVTRVYESLENDDFERARYYLDYAKDKNDTEEIKTLFDKINIAEMKKDYTPLENYYKGDASIDEKLSACLKFLKKYIETGSDEGKSMKASVEGWVRQLEYYKDKFSASKKFLEQKKFEEAFASLELAQKAYETQETRALKKEIISQCISSGETPLREWNYQEAEEYLTFAKKVVPQEKEVQDLERKFEYVKSLRKSAKLTKNKKGLWEADFGDDLVMVYIPELPGFWMGKTEVSIKQYMKFADEKDSNYPEWKKEESKFNTKTGTDPYYKGFVEDDHLPIVGIDRHDATAYCRWLSSKTGLPFKLPSEIQWKKAAQGKGNRKYPWGNEISYGNLANYGSPGGSNEQVNEYPRGASPYGMLNMAGNVEEWCIAADGSFAKGGGSFDGEAEIQINSRRKYDPSNRTRYLGFRLCMDGPGI